MLLKLFDAIKFQNYVDIGFCQSLQDIGNKHSIFVIDISLCKQII